ncbi:UNVERIFIED_ORG: hypothetical protein GGE64_002635 [Rhizobium etli]|uniref:DUF4150 domain-containing protein n=1 Tax=Rhizobium TaxID=379 RepID=UPI00098EF93D|nr:MULTISPECIES: DUF4150 domain-containing protein [Rhizobium]ARQ61807.1 PAAR motif-containing protein [Rhizobium sp. Kim5]RSC02032.1 DUF4150 domain-containing protein [Rhizobium sophoriradicis]
MSIPRDNYVGEPDYPRPWTTKQPREGLRDLDEARVVSLSPDVCLTPVGSSAVPVPYPIVDYCGHDKDYTPTVRFTGKKAMVMRSCTTHVHGDAPGTKKGFKSGTVENICEPIGHAEQVRAEGSHVIRHLDRFWMNNRNTQGEAIFIRGTETFAAPEDDDPVPGSLRWNGSDEGRVISDASPEPIIMGAQYAQAVPATVPQTVPVPARPAPVPRPPGQVIRPNVPQWNKPPPRPSIKVGKWVGRLGRFGRAMTGIGAFIEGMWPTSTAMPWYDEMPQDDFESVLFRKARELEEQGVDVDDIQEWFRSERAENARRRRQQEIEEKQKPQPLPQTEGARVDEEGSQRRCIVGPYEEIEPICRGNAHHIVPDMAYRLGRRPVKSEYNSTENRIPNAPTLNQGMSICLLTRQHGSDSEGLHGVLRQRFSDLASPVPGTAPMGAILAESLKVIEDIPDLPEECKALAAAMATGQVASKTGFAAPGRTKERPLPSGDAETVLRRGHY